MRSHHRARLAAAAALAIAAVVACTGGGDSADPRCAEGPVEYAGKATDEVCMTLLDAEDNGSVLVGNVNDSVFLVPTNGQGFASSVPGLTFTWTSSIDADGDTARAPAVRPRGTSLAVELVKLLNPVTVAWAHLPPVTGAVHMVRLKGVAGRSSPIIHFTTFLHWTLTAEDLAEVKATTTPMQIEITSAYVTENRILNPANDGPFRPAADTSFSILP